MRFQIQPSLPEPIYRQIADQIRRLVMSGQLQAEQELPSVRSVAHDYAINPMTVSKAYSLLEAEGVVERRRGMGMFVAAVNTSSKIATRLDALEPALVLAARQAAELGISASEALKSFEHVLKQQKTKPIDTDA